MTRRLVSWTALAGAAFVVLTTLGLVALGSRNRAEVEAELTLTERELALPDLRERENTGLFLRLRLASQASPELLRWVRNRRESSAFLEEFSFPWLTQAKLVELGLDAHDEPLGECDHCRRIRERRVLLVLEQDGEAWKGWMDRREQEVAELRRQAAAGGLKAEALEEAEFLLKVDGTLRSRLVPVDAGRDFATLRARHPDRTRYAILPGRLQVVARKGGKRSPVFQLENAEISVPLADKANLESLIRFRNEDEWTAHLMEAPKPQLQEPRYRVQFCIGTRLEPWIASVP